MIKEVIRKVGFLYISSLNFSSLRDILKKILEDLAFLYIILFIYL